MSGDKQIDWYKSPYVWIVIVIVGTGLSAFASYMVIGLIDLIVLGGGVTLWSFLFVFSILFLVLGLLISGLIYDSRKDKDQPRFDQLPVSEMAEMSVKTGTGLFVALMLMAMYGTVVRAILGLL